MVFDVPIERLICWRQSIQFGQSLGAVAAVPLLPVCQFQALILYLVMELLHALCSSLLSDTVGDG